ncbi:hypothetical protein [Nocardiopsis ganjiahuensis]|uniref:hypothetical protein n=1 Tax=Nocardiopsis ganjiahuensis TaxID=239984 RepID=UPI0003460053|nr:hypothetical protein [Nocardiopsis ganjiahuensis]
MNPQEPINGVHVPISVHALPVTPVTRSETAFERRTPNFHLTALRLDPEHEPFAGADAEFRSRKDSDGVYVQWTLPAALRHGRPGVGPGSTAVTFPAVPNRWLVTRTGTNAGNPLPPEAWIVESDYSHPERGSAPYVVGHGDSWRLTRIGRAARLVDWPRLRQEDPGHDLPEPLTALGPGLPAFTAYQPYHPDVLSFHDTLAGLDTPGGTGPDLRLNYGVVGWYSDPRLDPLNSDAGLDRALQDAGWHLASPGQPLTGHGRSVYGGAVHGVPWSPGIGTNAVPDPDDVGIAVGPTAVDAFLAALSSPSLGDQALDHGQAEALRHLGFGHLPASDDTDGAFTTAQRQFSSAFLPFSGGHRWTVDADEDATGAAKLAAELNSLQDQLDTARRELASARWEAYALWFARGRPALPSGLDRADFDQELDPLRPGTVAARIRQTEARITRLASQMPVEGPDRPLEQAVAEYRRARAVPSSWTVERSEKPAFHRAADPVALLTLPTTDVELAPAAPETQGCRFTREPGFVQATEENLPDLSPAWSESPELAEAILVQCGRCVVSGPAWHAPWQPLYLEWEVEVHPVPCTGADDPGWRFDGNRYLREETEPDHGDPLLLSGRQPVDTGAPKVFRSQLTRYAEQHPQLDEPIRARIEEFSSSIERWRVLAQPLTGFTDRLALRTPGLAPAPPPGTAALTGRGVRRVPDLGPLPLPFTEPVHRMAQTRATRFVFTRLTLVDRFGQALPLVTPDNRDQVTVDVSERLDSRDPARPRARDQFIRTQPRLLQAARLSFDLLDTAEPERRVDDHGLTQPVHGWLVPNHLDRTLMAFAADGKPLRQVGSAASELPTPPGWRSPQNHGPRPPGPALLRLLSTLESSQHFDEMWQQITTAAAVTSTGNSSGHTHLELIGRPLAVVRARLRLELDGPPLFDPSWRSILPSRRGHGTGAAYPSYPWAVRLGEPERTTDGLVGYTDVARPGGPFHGVNAAPGIWVHPAEGHDLLLRADGTSETTLTLLMDAHTPVHATTGILPQVSVRLPDRCAAPLSTMPAFFRVAPLLAPQNGASVLLPVGESPAQTWEWAEHEPGGTWKWWPTAPANEQAAFTPTPPLRNGLLAVLPTPSSR